jgi:arabinogalactan oligomer / maltooligosaccharide transport system substrate-binding protein
MTRTRSRLSWLACAAVLTLAAVVAAFGGTAKAAAPAPPKGSYSLTFWQTMNPQETKTLSALVKKFQAAYPTIKVKMVTVPFDGAQNKFMNAARAGHAPDVMRAEIAWTAQFASLGYLANIEKMVSAADRADYLPSAFAYNVYAGHVWGIPQVTDAPALLYNKAMFKAAGINGAPTSMDQLVADCNKLGDGKGIFLRGDSYFLQPWIWAYGGGLLDATKKKILINSPGSVAGLTAYNKLFHSSCAFEDKDITDDYGNMETAFQNGQVAMIVNGPWATAELLAGTAFKDPNNFGIAPVPAGPKGQGSPVGGHNYVISRQTLKKPNQTAAAYFFIQWLNQPAQQAQLAIKNNLVVTRKSTYNIPALKKNRILQDFLQVMKKATARPVIPEGGQIYTDFTPNFQKVLSGDLSPQAGLDAVAQAWGKFLKGYSS